MKKKNKPPGILWFKAMDRLFSKNYYGDVKSDIDNNAMIINSIKGFRNAFIRFAALERVHRSPDIVDEYRAYIERERTYLINAQKWQTVKKRIFVRDNYTCLYCGESGGILEIDHIFPFSKGGSDDDDNLTTSCRRCNRSKRNKTLSEYKEWLAKKGGCYER